MILDTRNRTEVLRDQPHAIWIILSLEITVELAGEHFLLVRYPYYALPDGRTNEIQEGHWYTPFVGFVAEVGTFPPQTIGDLIDRTEQKLASISSNSPT